MYEKLIKIQTELKAPKDQYNSFGKYSYRNCEDILNALKPLLQREKLALLISDEVVSVGERYYIKATAILTDGNNKIEASAFAREAENKKGMDESQITGAASSYARKYALNGLFCIDDTKDADSINIHEKETKEKPKEKENVNTGKVDNTLISLNQKNELKTKLSGKEFADLMNTHKNHVPLSVYNEIMGAA